MLMSPLIRLPNAKAAKKHKEKSHYFLHWMKSTYFTSFIEFLSMFWLSVKNSASC